MYDLAVFIGRFAPPHLGHLEVIKRALEQAEEMAIFVGSANRSPSIRNPFPVAFRINMIRSMLADCGVSDALHRVHLFELDDYLYNDYAWNADITASVAEFFPHAKSIALVGHSKDHSSYYLREFPQWKAIEIPNYKGFNSTNIRERYLDKFVILHDQVHPAVDKLLDDWELTPEFDHVSEEYAAIKAYKDQWKHTPFPVTFNTVDGVVTQGGHILVVERGDWPGKGLIALPGGFLDPGETLEQAIVRELNEETGLKVSKRTLQTCVVKRKTYDDPHRSSRGRTITHAFHFDLDRGPDLALPKVKGGSDAKHAYWLPIGHMNPLKMLEDHYFIVNDMLNMA